MNLISKVLIIIFFIVLNNEIYCFNNTNKDQNSTLVTVFIFLGTECPFSQNYTKTLNSLFEKYQSSGVKFVGLFPNSDDSKRKIKTFKKKYGLKFKVKSDKKHKFTNLYEAKVTPEVIVLNSTQNKVYSGKIDNWAEELGVRRSVITEFYLNDALHSIINNLPIKISKTEGVGCFIHNSNSHQNHLYNDL